MKIASRVLISGHFNSGKQNLWVASSTFGKHGKNLKNVNNGKGSHRRPLGSASRWYGADTSGTASHL